MVNSKLPKHGGMKVMDRDVILSDRVTKFIRFAPARTALDPGAGHPDGEGLNMVISSTALRHGRPSKLSSPDNEGILE